MKKLFIAVIIGALFYMFAPPYPAAYVYVTDAGDNTIYIRDANSRVYANKPEVIVTAKGSTVTVTWGSNAGQNFISFPYTSYAQPHASTADSVAYLISTLVNQ